MTTISPTPDAAELMMFLYKYEEKINALREEHFKNITKVIIYYCFFIALSSNNMQKCVALSTTSWISLLHESRS